MSIHVYSGTVHINCESGLLCDRLYESIPFFFHNAQLLLPSNHDTAVNLHASKEGARKVLILTFKNIPLLPLLCPLCSLEKKK